VGVFLNTLFISDVCLPSAYTARCDPTDTRRWKPWSLSTLNTHIPMKVIIHSAVVPASLIRIRKLSRSYARKQKECFFLQISVENVLGYFSVF